jgi:hypothetical protein
VILSGFAANGTLEFVLRLVKDCLDAGEGRSLARRFLRAEIMSGSTLAELVPLGHVSDSAEYRLTWPNRYQQAM